MASKRVNEKVKMPSDEHLRRLSNFLTEKKRPEQTFSLPQLRGFLFGVSCAPHEVDAEEWLPIIFNEQEPDFRDEEEEGAVLDVVMALYNYLDQQIEEHKVALPESCLPSGVLEKDFADDSPFHLWCSGFLIAHGWLDECWEGLDEELDTIIGSCMMVLSFYAERELAKTFYAEFSGSDESFEAMAEAVLAEFDEAMLGYADIGALLRSKNEEL